VNTRGRLLVLACIAGLLSSATAQQPPAPARNPDNLASPQNLNNPKYQSNPQDLGPNIGPPLFGAPRPDVRPDPNPKLRIRRPTDCPFGYSVPPENKNNEMAHLVVCVVKQPYEPEFAPAGPGPAIGGRSTATPTLLEHTPVNQCIGHMAGSYACGRGATECCGPNQDNMCFAGAFACYATSARGGPKKACCMSK
jgi:hypothetical protein